MGAKKAAVAMSGGVDSACAALVLQRAGWEVSGVTLQLCGTEDAARDAARTAAALGIPHTVLDLRERFHTAVVGRFLREYAAGRTPNPCVDCNREIKFGALLDWALGQGFDALATGHYARVCRSAGGRWQLLRGADARKDQSYFLYSLTQAQLARVLLPLGEYEKPAVRALAEARGLPCAHRADSQDICFVPQGDYTAVLRAEGAALTPGDFVDAAGRVLGRHRGLACYTVGQRKGLGVSAEAPLYVLAKNPAANTVVLGPEEALYTRELTAERMNWLSLPESGAPLRLTGKTRYSQRGAACTLRALPDGRAQAVFDEPQRAVTPGQAAVFYDGDAVAAGGTICAPEPSDR
jgi:tRNA-specific 2-thiouridylase